MDPREGIRHDGIRLARRVSNWTAALLLAVTGVSAAALARQASPPLVSGSPNASSGAAAVSGPSVKHSVATTTASGVTVTTTTQTVNGKTVITRVSSAPHYRDD
jgi:hypothetical protein